MAKKAQSATGRSEGGANEAPAVHVVDDDAAQLVHHLRAALSELVEKLGEGFVTGRGRRRDCGHKTLLGSIGAKQAYPRRSADDPSAF